MIEFKKISSDLAPMKLLLEADPSQECINKYLNDSDCFGAFDNHEIVGICISKQLSSSVAEIYNIAIAPEYQQKGIGSNFLKFVLNELALNGYSNVELGTGTFGYQLSFYQRHGFRVDSIVKDFFLDNYDEDIYENGIQHKDMLRLVCRLL
ncbi:GNAT family N-acetyltransferase [Aliivibrio fischeri]|uniref:GNAT family N-acetyltransferase n=1 Tax=Aliivibrio fischeri TaxID=668 RepID=UPI0012D9604D|nr:GNAT family N-acetyltransferase [Aliivibrio fischeri]MUK79067.1 GNAT family N-acetyltransferase [Aliivibrio fischeri]